MFTIYALIDVNKKPFYVGVTSKRLLSKRLSQHVYDAKHERGKNKAKDMIIKYHLDINERPSIVAIESQIESIEDADKAEQFYIKALSFLQLTNVKTGGYDYAPIQ